MTDICPLCQLPSSTQHDCHTALKATLGMLVASVGEPAKCRGCGASILWVRHSNGKNAPYDPSGANHFITCPVANRFRTPKRIIQECLGR